MLFQLTLNERIHDRFFSVVDISEYRIDKVVACRIERDVKEIFRCGIISQCKCRCLCYRVTYTISRIVPIRHRYDLNLTITETGSDMIVQMHVNLCLKAIGVLRYNMHIKVVICRYHLNLNWINVRTCVYIEI